MSTLNGVINALVEALERGDKLSFTGHLVVTDPDTEVSVQMVLDEDDFAVLKDAGSAAVVVALTTEEARGLRIAAMLGGPPADDPHEALNSAIRRLAGVEEGSLSVRLNDVVEALRGAKITPEAGMDDTDSWDLAADFLESEFAGSAAPSAPHREPGA